MTRDGRAIMIGMWECNSITGVTYSAIKSAFLKMGILLCIHHLSLRYIYKAPRQLTSTRVKCWAGS